MGEIRSKPHSWSVVELGLECGSLFPDMGEKCPHRPSDLIATCRPTQASCSIYKHQLPAHILGVVRAVFSFPWSHEPRPGFSLHAVGSQALWDAGAQLQKNSPVMGISVVCRSESSSIGCASGSPTRLQLAFPGDFCLFVFLNQRHICFPSAGMGGANHIFKELTGALCMFHCLRDFGEGELSKMSRSVLTWVMQTEEHCIRKPSTLLLN